MHFLPEQRDLSATVESIVDLTRCLVRIPSRAERDETAPIIELLASWLLERGAAVKVLTDDEGRKVAVLVTVETARPGPVVALDACVDTAGFGDETMWTHAPTGAEIEDGWLYGRGAADSKVAVAMFAHLALELQADPPERGRLLVLFDGDEHSGRFGGARAFLRIAPPLVGMMIGYPGNHGVVAGARGFWRATITVPGVGAHSGATSKPRDSALSKAARLVMALEEAPLKGRHIEGDFPFGPSLTVTAIHAGEGYSQVPDRCELRVDVRLTPSFTASEAEALVSDVIRQRIGESGGASMAVEESWPPYRLPADASVAVALRHAAARHLDREVPAVVCGPSNIGNLLSAHGIPATCGFGVTYRNIHGTDEAIELATIEPVYRTYRDAVRALLAWS